MKKYSEISIKIPPPLVTCLFACMMYGVDVLFPLTLMLPIKAGWVSAFFVFSGVLLFPAVRAFYKNKTTVNPLKPEAASVLVTKGIYNYSRNPMYLGMASLLVAWLLVLENPLNTVTLIGFIGYMNAFQIAAEEQALGRIFGEEFKRYKQNVRRWI